MRWRRRNADRDLNEEIDTHLAMAVADRVARGEDRGAARSAARREFGNVAHVKEITRETWGGASLERLWQDIRYAARSLRRSPVFAITAIATVAVGIAANAAMFTIVRSVLLRPMPFANPNELFVVSRVSDRLSAFFPLSMPDREYFTYADAQRAFSSTAIYRVFPATLLDAGDPVRLPVALVSPDFFRTLGVWARTGRVFEDADGVAGTTGVAVIGASLWRERFGGDSSVIGKSVRVDDARRTIVGIMPDGFDFPRRAQIWLPMGRELDPHNARLMLVIGRLANAQSSQAALAELERLGDSHDGPTLPSGADRPRAQVISLHDAVVGNVRIPLLIFSGAVALVLLIACLNVSNLLLMRAAARRHELGIRAALGAGRLRLIRALLAESVVIALIGGAAGFALATLGVRVLLRLLPPGLLPRASEVHPDAIVLAITFIACGVCGLAAGIVPALSASRRDAREAIGGGTRATARSGMRGVFVTLEVAVSLVLLVGTGLTIRSFNRLTSVDLGFSPDHLVTATIDLPESRYRTPESIHAVVGAIAERLAAIPHVERVAAVNWLPLDSSYIAGDFTRYDGKKLPENFVVLKPFVTPGYFATMGVRMVDGREFFPSDAGGEAVAIVSQNVARRLWPDGAVGQRISYSDHPGPGDWITIIGVAADVVRNGPSEPPMPAIYRPVSQSRQLFFINHLTFVARVDGDPAATISAVRAAIHAGDGEQPIRSVATMDSRVQVAVAEPRFRSIASSTFAALALMLAAIGIYGVLAYSVSEQRRELGIRLALGASPGAIGRRVFSVVASLVVPGIILGLAGALISTRVLSRFLFGVEPNDPLTYALASAVLIGAAVLAGLGPAHRAGRIDPLITMRA